MDCVVPNSSLLRSRFGRPHAAKKRKDFDRSGLIAIAMRRSTCLVFLLLCCRSTLGSKHLLRSNQGRVATSTKDGDQFIFTTLAIAGAAYGAYQAGDAIAHHVNAKEHAKQYKKGIKDAIRYALHKDEFDLTTNNMATMLIMNAWDNCLPLRGFTTAIWKELLLKREVHKQKVEEQRDALKETLLDTKEAYDVESMVQSSAEDACMMFDDEHSSSIANFFSDLSAEDLEDMNDSSVDTSSSEAVLLSLTITGVKLFAKGSEKFHEDSSLNAKRKSHEYSAWFSKLASYTGTGMSLIGAMFDPTGLSIMSLAGSIAGSAGAESMAKEERMGWKQHYCPALDDALLHNNKKLKEVTGMKKINHVQHHFGPIVNNVDCLERTTKALCLMPVEKECVKQKKTRLCRMKNMVSLSDEDEEDYDHLEELEECDHLKSKHHHHDNDDVGGCYWNVNPDDSGEDGVERCSACPYAYNHYREGIPGFMTPTKDGIDKCENHISPNGEFCRFKKGTFKDECCAQTEEEKINEEMCY